MTLHDVPAERRARGRGKFEVDDGSGAQIGQGGAGESLFGEVGGEGRQGDIERGEADAVDRDRIADVQARGDDRRTA
jgi:hypothetical protein